MGNLLGGSGAIFGSNPPAPVTLPTKVRKDPLTNVHANALVDYTRTAEALLLIEHDNLGNHNALEVPREVGVITFAAGAYAVAAQSSRAFITGVVKQAVGQCRLTLSGAALRTGNLADDACFSLTPTGNGLETKPQIVNWKVVDNTHLDVYIRQLSSPLGGAGNNTWALTDDGFVFALHASPLTTNLSRFPSDNAFKPHVRGSNLSALSTDWNTLIQLQGDTRKAFLVAHTAAGIHNTQEVAKKAAHVQWTGAIGRFVENSGFSTVTRNLAGKYTVTFPATANTNFEPFVEVDWPRSNAGVGTESYIIGVPKSQWTMTQVQIFIYKYDPNANAWTAADTDFYLALHHP